MMLKISNFLFTFLVNSFVCLVALRYMRRIFGGLIVNKRIYGFVAALSVVFVTIINNYNKTSITFDMVSGTIIVFVLMFFHIQRLRLKLLFCMLFIAMAGISEVFSFMLIGYVFKMDLLSILSNPLITATCVVCSVVVFLILSELIVKLQAKKQVDIPIRFILLSITIPIVISILTMFWIWIRYIESVGRPSLLEITVLLGVLYVNFMGFYLFGKISGLFLERIQHQMQAKHYAELESYQTEIRRIKHDMKNHLLTLNRIVDESESKDVRGYIASLLDSVEYAPSVIDTGNPPIDSVLNIKLGEAKKAGIDVQTDIIIPKGLKISFDNAVGLFGNLLDNAIEASVLAEDKIILIKMNVVNQALYIQTSNHSMNKSDSLLTTKADKINHGFGLRNISLVVKEYNGTMKVERKDDIFTVKIVLYGIL